MMTSLILYSTDVVYFTSFFLKISVFNAYFSSYLTFCFQTIVMILLHSSWRHDDVVGN